MTHNSRPPANPGRFNSPAELGLKEDAIGGGIEIKQLRPLYSDQPWGMFFLNLPHKHLPQTIVRNILGRLTIKKRKSSNPSERAAFAASDILFIAATGSAAERRLDFAHFTEDPLTGDTATLKILGWDGSDTVRRLNLTGAAMKMLEWPDRPSDA